MPLSKEQIEIERVKFENWFLQIHGWHDCFRITSNEYMFSDVEKCFDGWLACRESIEIELPEPKSYSEGNGYPEGKLESFLEAQGFKVKS